MQFNIPWHDFIEFVEELWGEHREIDICSLFIVQYPIISDLTRCQPMFSTLSKSVFTAYAIHKFIKYERRCVWTGPSPRRGSFIEEGAGDGGGGERAWDDFPPTYFLFPSYPGPVYFIFEIRTEALYGEQITRPKSPSPASLSDRSVIL